MEPSQAEQTHFTQSAFALAAVEHHVDAGVLERFQHGLSGGDGCLDAQPGHAHHELLGVEPAAVAKGLVAEVCHVERPRHPSRRLTASMSRIGPHMYSSVSGSIVASSSSTSSACAFIVHVDSQRVAVQLLQLRQVRHGGAAAAGVHEGVVGLDVSEHPGHADAWR